MWDKRSGEGVGQEVRGGKSTHMCNITQDRAVKYIAV
jgi:hypothetical protein